VVARIHLLLLIFNLYEIRMVAGIHLLLLMFNLYEITMVI